MSTTINNQIQFAWLSKLDIQAGALSGELTPYSICYAKDTNQQFIIDENQKVIPIRSRLEIYDSVSAANADLQTRTSAYVGEIVSILEDNYYKAYMVQQNASGTLYVQAIHESVDYNALLNRPIENITGTSASPIEIKDLDDGHYLVKGSFILPGQTASETSDSGDEFIIRTIDSKQYVTQISANKIYRFTINGATTTTEHYITDADLTEREKIYDQVYIKSENLDQEVAALNYIKQAYVDQKIAEGLEEIKGTISEKVEEILDAELDDKLDEELDERLNPLTKQEVDQAFDENQSV